MANYLEFTPNVSWAKVRVGYEESYDAATKASTLTITSIEVMSTQYTAEYYVDGVLNVNGTAVLTSKSSTGNVMVAVKAKNTWYPIEKDGSPVTATVQIEGSETATIELTGNNFQRFAFYTVDGEDGNGWGVSESQEIALTVEKGFDDYSFWLGVALDRACVGSPQTKPPTAYLYNGVQLPPLPEWDREMYPYALISDRYTLEPTLVLTSTPLSTPMEAIVGGNYIKIATECLYMRYVLENNAWAIYNEPKTSTDASELYTDLVWSNYDIPNVDGTVYLAASDPIPVYE